MHFKFFNVHVVLSLLENNSITSQGSQESCQLMIVLIGKSTDEK